MLPEEIIVKPIVTEKSNDGVQSGTKVDIKRACEKLFGVKVLNVNTSIVKGKTVRRGRSVGKTSDWKKAIVTIDTNPEEQSYLAKGGKAQKVSKKYKDSIEGIN